MEQKQSFFQRYGLLLSTTFLFGTMIFLAATGIFDKETDYENEWVCSKITKVELQKYFADDGAFNSDYYKITFGTRIDNPAEPFASMSILQSLVDYNNEYMPYTKTNPAAKKTNAIPRLFMTMPEVHFDDLRKILFDQLPDGTYRWKEGLDYVLLTPEESTNHLGYFTITLQAMRADNTQIPAAALQANPIPPGRPKPR